MGVGASAARDTYSRFLTQEMCKSEAGDEYDHVQFLMAAESGLMSRKIFQAKKDKLLAARAAKAKCEKDKALAAEARRLAAEKLGRWQKSFAALCVLSVKDIAHAFKTMTAAARTQVIKEERAPFFTMLGGATPTTEGYSAPPEALTQNKLGWLAMFDSFEAYHDGEHQGRTQAPGAELDIIKQLSLTQSMADFMGGFRGACFHMENKAPKEGPTYCVYVTAKAKNSAAAAQILKLRKAMDLTPTLRSTIFLPGGDIPPQFQDEVTLRWVDQYATADDHEAHKKGQNFVETTAGCKELTEEYSVVEFGGAIHYIKPPPPAL